jgi:hypothetical protein
MTQLTIIKELFAQAKLETITLMVPAEYSITRKGKKSDTERSIMGVVSSGTRAERDSVLRHEMLAQWTENRLATILKEIKRVFPTVEKTVEARNKNVNNMIAECPELADKLKLVNMGNPGKMDLMAIMKIASDATGADKGEKARFVECFKHINAFEMAVMAKYEALRIASTQSVGAETPVAQ